MRKRSVETRGETAHALEARRLLSLWTVDGTTGDDTINIWRGVDFIGTPTIYARVNGVIQSRWESQVSSMQIAADSGNDTISTADITRGSYGTRWLYVLGGFGNDRIEIGGNDANIHQSRTWVDGGQGDDTLGYRDENGVVALDVTPYRLTEERLIREDLYNGSGAGWVDPGERYHYNIEAFRISGIVNTGNASNAGNRFALNGLAPGNRVSIFGGNGRDELEVGSSNGRATLLGLSVFFSGGGGGTDLLNYRDQTSRTSSTYENFGTRIVGSDGSSTTTVDFNNLETVNVFGGTDRDFMFFYDPLNSEPVGTVVMHGGGGNDLALAGGHTGDFLTGIPAQLGRGIFVGGEGNDFFQIFDQTQASRNYYFGNSEPAYGDFFTIGGPLNSWDVDSVESILIVGAQSSSTWEGRINGNVRVDAGDGFDTFAVSPAEGLSNVTLNGGNGDDLFLIDAISTPRNRLVGISVIGGAGTDFVQLDDRPGPDEIVVTEDFFSVTSPSANEYSLVQGVLTASTTFDVTTLDLSTFFTDLFEFSACTRMVSMDLGSVESFTLREAPALDWNSDITLDLDRFGLPVIIDLGPGGDRLTLTSDYNGTIFGGFNTIPNVQVVGGTGNDLLVVDQGGVTIPDTHRVEAGYLMRADYSQIFHDAESISFVAGSNNSLLDIYPENLFARIVPSSGFDSVFVNIPMVDSVHSISIEGDSADHLMVRDPFNHFAEPNSFFIAWDRITLGQRLNFTAQGFRLVTIVTSESDEEYEIEQIAWPLTLQMGGGAADVSYSTPDPMYPVRLAYNGFTGSASASDKARIELLGPATLHSIQAVGNARVTLHGALLTVTRTNLLIVEGNGRIDLGGGSLVVDYIGASPIAAIVEDLRSAYDGGWWSGPGIGTSAAFLGSLGYAEASAILGPAGGIFAGVPVDGSAVLIRLTTPGDANLDRQVNFSDLLTLSQNYGASGRGWWQGSFDYDSPGAVAFSDLLMLSQNYGASSLTTVTRSRSRRVLAEVTA
jgi:hypothetical protein